MVRQNREVAQFSGLWGHMHLETRVLITGGAGQRGIANAITDPEGRAGPLDRRAFPQYRNPLF
jgi:hypothetical protein